MSLQTQIVPEPARITNLACAKCGAAEVRRLSLIYQEGLSTINTQSQTMGQSFGGGGAAFGSASTHTTGRQQTALSKQASPPAKKHTILWSICAGIFGLVALSSLSSPGFGTLITIAITAASVRFALQAKAYNAMKFPELYQRWERSFMCNRCGEVFTP
jgi:hypothetical protein